MKSLNWWLDGASEGSMDDDGFLQFKAPTSKVEFPPFEERNEVDVAEFGWESTKNMVRAGKKTDAGVAGTHAIVIGRE